VPVYKFLHGVAPLSLSDDCQLVAEVGRQHLTCVPCCGQSQIGERSFTPAGALLHNSLPIEKH